MTENYELNPNVTMPTIILTDPGASGDPEPRKLFRKRVNGVGLTLLGNLGVTLALSYIIMYTPVLFMLIFGGYPSFSEAASALFGGEYYYLLMLIASAVAALIGNTLPAIIHAKKQGFNPFDGFKKGTHVPELGFKCMVFAFGLNYLWAMIYTMLITMFPNAGFENSEFGLEMPEKTGEIIVYSIFVCIIAPITEEFLFRGVILRSLSKYGTVFAGVTSAVLFGLLHGNFQQTPMAFLVGLVLAYAAIRTGSLRLPILIHFVVNTSSTLVNFAMMSDNMLIANTVTSCYAMLMLAALVATAVIFFSNFRRIHWLPQNPAESHTVLAPVKTKVKVKPLYLLICFWMLMFLVYCVDTINYSLGNKALLELIGETLYPILYPIING